eukprot:jgi/Botrbrau1/16095/Bobra.7_2s0061.1
MEHANPLASISRVGPDGRNLGNLPYDLLRKILSSLDPSSIRTARLVCRAFRAAFIPCITSLPFIYRRELEDAQDLLNDCHIAFTAIRNLDLCIHLPADLPALGHPLVLLTLRSLHLLLRPTISVHYKDCLHSFGLQLAEAARLTALEFDMTELKVRCDRGIGTQYLSSALASCRSLVKLTLEGLQPTLQFLRPLLAATMLRKLSLFSEFTLYRRAILEEGGSLLMGLQSLEVMPLTSEEDISKVAALTQLTRLGTDFTPVRWRPEILELSRLSAMQELGIDAPTLSTSWLRELVMPMSQLRELSLGVWDARVGSLDHLLTQLPALTKFMVQTASPVREFPPAFAPQGLAQLRELSMTLRPASLADPADVVRLATTVTALQSLEVFCDSGACYQLLMHLPPMPHLTELHVLSEQRPAPPTLCSPSGRRKSHSILPVPVGYDRAQAPHLVGSVGRGALAGRRAVHYSPLRAEGAGNQARLGSGVLAPAILRGAGLIDELAGAPADRGCGSWSS